MANDYTSRPQFDFDEYNKATKAAGAGLKLFLAIQMLEDVEKSARRFKNPLRSELSDTIDELNDLRSKWKKIAETAQKTNAAAAQADAHAAGETVVDENAPLATA